MCVWSAQRLLLSVLFGNQYHVLRRLGLIYYCVNLHFSLLLSCEDSSGNNGTCCFCLILCSKDKYILLLALIIVDNINPTIRLFLMIVIL